MVPEHKREEIIARTRAGRDSGCSIVLCGFSVVTDSFSVGVDVDVNGLNGDVMKKMKKMKKGRAVEGGRKERVGKQAGELVKV